MLLPVALDELASWSWEDTITKLRNAQRFIDNSPSPILTLCEGNPSMLHDQLSFTPPDRLGVVFTRGEQVRYMADVVTIRAITDRAVELWFPKQDFHVSIPRTGPDSWRIGQIQKFDPCAGKLKMTLSEHLTPSAPRQTPEPFRIDGIEVKVGDFIRQPHWTGPSYDGEGRGWHKVLAMEPAQAYRYGNRERGVVTLAYAPGSLGSAYPYASLQWELRPRPLPAFKDQDGIEIQVGDQVYATEYPNTVYTVKELLPNGLRCGGVVFPGRDFTFYPDPNTRVQDLTYPTLKGDVLKVGDRVTLQGSSPCVISRIRSNGRVWLRYEDSGRAFPGGAAEGAINGAEYLKRVPSTVTITRTMIITGTPEQVAALKQRWAREAAEGNAKCRRLGVPLGSEAHTPEGCAFEVTAYTEETK